MKKFLNYLIKAILAILLISLYQCQLPRFINLESGMAMGAESCIVRYKADSLENVKLKVIGEYIIQKDYNVEICQDSLLLRQLYYNYVRTPYFDNTDYSVIGLWINWRDLNYEQKKEKLSCMLDSMYLYAKQFDNETYSKPNTTYHFGYKVMVIYNDSLSIKHLKFIQASYYDFELNVNLQNLPQPYCMSNTNIQILHNQSNEKLKLWIVDKQSCKKKILIALSNLTSSQNLIFSQIDIYNDNGIVVKRYKPNIALTSKNAQTVFDEYLFKSVQYINNSYEN